ncbi:hypothetical protein Pelo_17167 [Pelomyxa schiedti]|nr:hypothetical protein Pelo_17167 [Pelomyxa schiedti]
MHSWVYVADLHHKTTPIDMEHAIGRLQTKRQISLGTYVVHDVIKSRHLRDSESKHSWIEFERPSSALFLLALGTLKYKIPADDAADKDAHTKGHAALHAKLVRRNNPPPSRLPLVRAAAVAPDAAKPHPQPTRTSSSRASMRDWALSPALLPPWHSPSFVVPVPLATPLPVTTTPMPMPVLPMPGTVPGTTATYTQDENGVIIID